MAAASLALSIVALVVSAASLGWTIYSWHRSGARLKVKATSFVLIGPGQAGANWLIAIDVTNAGRTPTTVHSLGFQSPEYKGVIALSDAAVGPNPIPKRLEPGEALTFPVEPRELLRTCAEKSIDSRKLTAYANSGHGRFAGKFDASALSVMTTARGR